LLTKVMLAASAFARVIIIGNSGAGKTRMAGRLVSRLACPCHGLDDIHWEPGGYTRAREPAAASRLLHDIAQGENWIIEGVFGTLAELALPRATLLLWLDLPVSDCVLNLRLRGEAANRSLLDWAEGYTMRDSPSSHHGHLRLFRAFHGSKRRLQSLASCDAFQTPG
jgi:adenylate kinase family enzyme